MYIDAGQSYAKESTSNQFHFLVTYHPTHHVSEGEALSVFSVVSGMSVCVMRLGAV